MIYVHSAFLKRKSSKKLLLSRALVLNNFQFSKNMMICTVSQPFLSSATEIYCINTCPVRNEAIYFDVNSAIRI